MAWSRPRLLRVDMATPAAPTPGNITARALSTISGPSVTVLSTPRALRLRTTLVMLPAW